MSFVCFNETDSRVRRRFKLSTLLAVVSFTITDNDDDDMLQGYKNSLIEHLSRLTWN